jgi:hypothetical protein
MATNGIEGGTPYLTLAVSVAFCAWGARRSNRVLLVAFGVAALLLAGWGAWHQGFPQFSELGWI